MEAKKYDKSLLTKIPIFDVDSSILNTVIADHLKQSDILTLPDNVDIIKTGVAKEMPPCDKDWYYKRAASVLRKVVLNSMTNKANGIGTNFFGKKYSAKKNRGVRPSKMAKGATGHVKAILEDFVKCGWFVKAEVGYKANDQGFNVMKEFVEKVK